MRSKKINRSISSDHRKEVMKGRRKDLAKAVLITEKVRKESSGEASAEEIVRRFRNERYEGSH